MLWVLAIALGLVALVLAVPVTRRAAVLAFVFSRRLLPVIGRKLHLVTPGYTTARAIRLAFEDLGPAYIKFGQMIASSPTAFSEATIEEFARCLDAVRPIPLKEVRRILREDLGALADTAFVQIEEAPLASASIAQVHAGVLRGGMQVVVKVQRPGIRSRIEQDLALMGMVARLAMTFNPLLRRANLLGIVGDFRRTIREELNFVLEADNIEAFNELLEREGLLGLARAPSVQRELTTTRVLTMERFYGVRIDNKQGVDDRVDDVVDMLRATSEVFWSCVFLGGFFHGDIHAGNIMVLDDGRLGYLDFGIFGRFSDEHRAALADWVGAMVSGNGEQMARAIRDMGAVGEGVDWDAYVSDVTEAFLPLRALTVDQPEMIEQFFPKLLVMARKHDLRLPSQFVLILKQLTYFGRYVMLHAPKYNENLDPKSQQTFVKIFLKFNAWRQREGARVISIRPSA
ncbi:MAG: putative aarF protein kinase chloroplastic [Deltaproteobacteria bacterium]|nr:putative aarF protein kinase chloroplastic [Deltaproteobacteria bacterium]